MLTKFFLDRPVFANVIAIVTMLIGAVAVYRLPVEQYPPITPPTVSVTTMYPGANASTIAETVAAPIEQQVNGVQGMLYMSSTSSSDGTYKLTVTFDVGTNMDMAEILVKSRVDVAVPQLPEEVRRLGVTTKKQSTNILLVVTLTSPDRTFDSLYLANYGTTKIRDELARIPGVGDVIGFGAGNYSMRIWLDPEKMKARGLSTQDVLAAVQEQNIQVAAGGVGQPPTAAGQNFQYTISAMGRLIEPEQFGNIIVKTGEQRRATYLKDVARVELGAQVYDNFALNNGDPAASLAVYQLPGANALDVAERVKKLMERLGKSFPKGLEYQIPFNPTEFVSEAIGEVYRTLIEAGVLVLIVILVFLQDWRAVLVPATTVPVTIIGAFTAMAALGFSVNMLTLFGLVLAIGIVVDDAIVIVENVAHHMEHGLDARNATIKGMSEVIGPVIGITLVLMAVFLPTAGLQGITGQMYRQFALTIAATAVISAINAVTLKPVQCASYLRPAPKKKFILYRWFNAVYDVFEWMYIAVVRVSLKVWPLTFLAFTGFIVGTVWLFMQIPTGFLPTEDQGYFVTAIQLPDSASLQRTEGVVNEVSRILQETEGIEHVFAIGGYSLLDGVNNGNSATIYTVYKSFDERKGKPNLHQFAILGSLRQKFAGIKDAIVFSFPPPAISGLGNTAGFQLQLQDRDNIGLQAMQQMVGEIMNDARSQSGLAGMNTTFRSGVPQLYADVDRFKVKTLGLRLSDVFGSLQSYLGSAYVNDFNKLGRTWQVRVQADQQFRLQASDVRRLEVRNASGGMIPLGSVVTIDESVGPQIVNRYNMYLTAAINGEAAPGYSSGDALAIMEQMLADKLPAGMGYDWTAMSYQEKLVGGEQYAVFGLATLLVYLVLAAQYNSWITPLAVILVVPLGLLGAGAAVLIRGMDNNVYTQIGIVLIIALASKNAILIVEFARELRAAGKTITESAIESAQLRFRPILMTSFAFILGVYPLVVAQGAGAASRQALGTAVFGGMITSTFLAVLFVPASFLACQGLVELLTRKPATPPTLSTEHPATAPPSQ